MKKLYFKAGQEIIAEGTLSDCAYIVESGSVEVSRVDSNGKKQVLDQLHENEIFGELGLIDGLPRSATVTAMTDGTIRVLSQESFDSLAANNPEALIPILKVLAKRLRSTLILVKHLQNQRPVRASLT